MSESPAEPAPTTHDAGTAAPETVSPPSSVAGDSRLDSALEAEIASAMAEMSSEDLAELAGREAPLTPAPSADALRDGVRRGRVVAVHGDDVFIELGGKNQAAVKLGEFGGAEHQPAVGAMIDVVIDRLDRASGLLLVHLPGAVRPAHWDNLSVGVIVEGRVTGMNKGGLEVDLKGVRAFLPASQVDVAHIKDISIFIGETVRCEVAELDRRHKSIVLSRRRVVEKEREEHRLRLIGELAEGQFRSGTVRNLTDFGAFVDLGGVEGLIHISDLSYAQVKKVSDVVSVGQTVEVKILKISSEKKRISLGLKQVKPDPWIGVEERYPIGTRLRARVVRTADFGAFAELEEGVDGLIPISEMSWTQRVKSVADVVSEGQVVDAVVIRVEPEKRRIALSMKQVAEDPWAGVFESFPVNSVINGNVSKLAEFGAFVEIAPGVEGLVHISELSDQRVKKVSDIVQPGQQVQVKVLGIDGKARRVSLSIKSAAARPEPVESAAGPAKPAKKRKKELRGGLSSHFDWGGTPLKF